MISLLRAAGITTETKLELVHWSWWRELAGEFTFRTINCSRSVSSTVLDVWSLRTWRMISESYSLNAFRLGLPRGSQGWMAAKTGFDPCLGSHQLAFQVKMRAHALLHLSDWRHFSLQSVIVGQLFDQCWSNTKSARTWIPNPYRVEIPL